jgi:hypothetical protein
MKKLGKEVFLLRGTEKYPRSGEGAFLRLNDGRIMYAFTKYYDGVGADHDSAYIAACYSSDEGESWSEDSVLLEKGANELNIMSVSLIRMDNGDLGIIYLTKNENPDGGICCLPTIRRSSDEGKNFSAPTYIVDKASYYVLNNDRVIRLKSGRIIFAVADHGIPTRTRFNPGEIAIFYSDDDGRSFKRSPTSLKSQINDALGYGYLEPGLFEIDDGTLWLYIRTGYGYQYQSFSTDGGISWSEPAPNYKLTSPSAPMLVKRAGNYTVAVFNPMPWASAFANKAVWGVDSDRNPYVMAVSLDGGKSLADQDFSNRCGEFLPYIKHCFYLEPDRNCNYCYPAIIEVADGMLVAYYYINSEKNMSLKITKISFAELDEAVCETSKKSEKTAKVKDNIF